MDILDRFAMREMGFSRQYVGLNRAIEEVAESSLIDSSFSHQLCKFPDDTKSTHLLCVSSNGKLLASCHGNRRIHVTDVNTGKILHSLDGHGSNPWALSFHPSRNDLLASGCLLGEVRVWDLKTGYCEVLEGQSGSGAVASVAFHPEGRLLVIATSNRLLFWDWNCHEPWKILESPCKKERIRYVKFDDSGQLLYTAITNASGSRRTTTTTASIPTTVMPSEYREMVYSRQELIDMRTSLARRHENLVGRYNTLLQRYRQLRARYPEYAGSDDPSPPDPDLGHRPSDPSDDRSLDEEEESREEARIESMNRRGPGSQSSAFSGRNIVQDSRNIDSDIPSSSRTSPISNVFQRRRELRERIQQAIRDQTQEAQSSRDFRNPMRSTEPVVVVERFDDEDTQPSPRPRNDSTPNRTQNQDNAEELITPRRPPDDLPENHYVPPLSPIQLERLNNAVTYAHDLSQRTLSQFMERHNASMMRLERSYRILEEQAVTLEQNFRRVYEEITRFQRQMSRMASEAPLPSNAEGQSWAGGLLRSLSAMQQIITRDISLEDMREAPMVRETGVLLEALSVVLTPEDDQNTADIPREILNGMVEIRDYFRSIQQQLEEIRTLAAASAADGRSADYPPELLSVQERLVIGIRMVQDLIRSWKTRVVSSIREESGEEASTSQSNPESGVSVYQRVLSLWSSPQPDTRDETETAVSNLAASMDGPRPQPRPAPASPLNEEPSQRTTLVPINLPTPANPQPHADQALPTRNEHDSTQSGTTQETGLLGNVPEPETTDVPGPGLSNSGTIRISPLKRPSAVVEQERDAGADQPGPSNRPTPTDSSQFILPPDRSNPVPSVTLNLSPSRVQKLSSPRGRTILRYSSPFAENPGPRSRDTTPQPPENKRTKLLPVNRGGSLTTRTSGLTALRGSQTESPNEREERPSSSFRTPVGVPVPAPSTPIRHPTLVAPTRPARRVLSPMKPRDLMDASDFTDMSRPSVLMSSSRGEGSTRANPFVNAREVESRGARGNIARDLESATSSLSAEIYGRDRNSGSQRPLISLELGRNGPSHPRRRFRNIGVFRREGERRWIQPWVPPSFVRRPDPRNQPRAESPVPESDRSSSSQYTASSSPGNDHLRSLGTRPPAFRTILQARRTLSSRDNAHYNHMDAADQPSSSRNETGPFSSRNYDGEGSSNVSNQTGTGPRTATLRWNPRESREWNFSQESPSSSGRALVVQVAAEARIARRETVANFVSRLNAAAAAAGSNERMPQPDFSPSTRRPPDQRVINDDVYVRVPPTNRGNRPGRGQAGRYVRVAGLPARSGEEDLQPAQPPNPIEDDDDLDYAQDLNHAINRAIAGAFIGTGDTAIATNILDLTCRIQEWKFNTDKLPNIADAKHNVIAKYAKVHNDGSLSFSHNGQLMACFTENLQNDNPIWTDTVLQIISLRSYDKGVVLFQKSFGPNAVSLCISPCDSHIMIGLATRRYLRLRHSPETFAQIFHLSNYESPEDKNHEMKLVLNLNRVIPEPTNPEDVGQIFASRNCTLNCALWLTNPGEGFAYGTNKGQLCLIKPLAGSGRREKDKIAASGNNINRRARSQRYGTRNPGMAFYN